MKRRRGHLKIGYVTLYATSEWMPRNLFRCGMDGLGLNHPQRKKKENNRNYHQHKCKNHHDFQSTNVRAKNDGDRPDHDDSAAPYAGFWLLHAAATFGLPALIHRAEDPCKDDQHPYEHDQEPQDNEFHRLAIRDSFL